MKKTLLVLRILLIVFPAILNPLISKAVCTWHWNLYDGFEYTTAIPDIIPGTTYQTAPQTFAVHSGTRSAYFNFQNGLAAGTLFYSRQLSICTKTDTRISFWLCTSFSGVQCNLKIEIKDANGNVVSQIDSLAAGYAPAWTHYQSGTFLPLTAPITLNIYTNIPGSAGGNDLSIDDIVVEQCSNLNIGPDTTICNTASIVLNAGGVAGNYIWSVGSTNPSIVASTSNPGVSTTTYYVQVMDTGGCIFKDTATVTFTICTGIENLIKENPLVFSQPLKEYLQLYDASGILSVSIYDLSGAKVKKYNSQEIFYVGDLPSGYYLFHAEKTDGERLIIKFLKE